MAKLEPDAEVAPQHALGRLTARERLSILFDAGSMQLHAAEDGIVTASGRAHGRPAFVFAKDRLSCEGTLNAAHAAAILALCEAAILAEAPLIGLYDSSGLRANEGLATSAAYGAHLRGLATASKRIPVISAIMGPCVGADAIAAATSDVLFMVEETSELFLAGPAIVNAFTDLAVSVPELGGAALHAGQSGLCDHVFRDDVTALIELRRFLDFLPSSKSGRAHDWASFDAVDRSEPSLATLVPDEASGSYDIKELILKIADEGDVFELQEHFAQNIVTVFCRMNGSTVGIVANQPSVLGGTLDLKAAKKATRFVMLCARFHIPLVTLVDAPGFLPGQDQEEGGIAREAAALAAAFAQAEVPRVALICGQAFGPAWTILASREMGIGPILAWPCATLGLAKIEGAIFSAPEALAQGAIDDIIAPQDTRAHIIAALAMRHTQSGKP